MGAARIAPGLALLLCCPVLSSAYVLVSPPLAVQARLRACSGVPGRGLGVGGRCPGLRGLSSPSILNFGWASPLARDPRCLLSLGCLNSGFQMPKTYLFLKTGLGSQVWKSVVRVLLSSASLSITALCLPGR